MSSFVLKIIAIISMVFDHVGYIIFGKFSFMNYIGRLAFPIFAFGIAEGFKYTKDLKKYFLRLSIFALISQIPYMLFLNSIGGNFTFNILFTLILGLLAITIYEKMSNKYLGLLFVILCGVIAHFGHFDYGWFGIAVIFIFHIFKDKKILMNLSFTFAVIINYIPNFITTSRIEYIFITLFCCLSLIPINLYNDKKGKDIKYTLYLFYPLHLVVLYLLNFFV